ncbi:MAG: excinuclease ABC subunit UvrC [bacterium]|nr:excinuclease ABC subunit UvrC [bacterium]
MEYPSQKLKQQVEALPETPGVYIYKNTAHQIIYVGKAINLKSRVRSYFQSTEKLGPKTIALVSNIDSMENVDVESEFEALLLEAELIKLHKPRYNIVLKDDKSYLYIKITTSDTVPRISVARRENLAGVSYFGPYPSAQTAKSVLKTIRKIFPYRSCKTLPTTPCLFYHIKLCPAPCADLISIKDYKDQIKQITLFLSGKRKAVEKNIGKEMEQASVELRFEDAQKLKKQLDDITYITQSFRRPQDYIENPNLIEDQRLKTMQELHSHLVKHMLLPTLPHRIECYDISNIQGKNAVGAMVVFTDTQPDKKEYRKFKIRTKDTPDDYTMMKEVLTRRFGNSWPTPDLIVIDGGKGQLDAAHIAMQQAGVNIPVISLAKRLEEIYIKGDNEFIKLDLERNSKALQVLQFIRDEAHRFGITFHRSLRAKKLLS